MLKGVADLNELDFDLMVRLIACGLYEKRQCSDKYCYSSKLFAGINRLAALATENEQYAMLSDLHECAFIENYAVKPVKTWFEGWNSAFVKIVEKFDLYHTNALIELSENRRYTLTDDCVDLISDSEKDYANDLEQRYIYSLLTKLTDELYVAVRRFIVENPICSDEKMRKFKMEHCEDFKMINKTFSEAYENVPNESYICPKCGWTMTFYGAQAQCCNKSCLKYSPKKEDLKPLRFQDGNCRLRHGVMRYMCLPAQLELMIQEIAEKCGCVAELWPDRDKYDVKITLPDGQIWAIDAKTHRNPYMLKKSIEKDCVFTHTKAQKVFYVVPDDCLTDYPDYCKICNDALANSFPDSIAKCVSMRNFSKELKGEVEDVKFRNYQKKSKELFADFCEY